MNIIGGSVIHPIMPPTDAIVLFRVTSKHGPVCSSREPTQTHVGKRIGRSQKPSLHLFLSIVLLFLCAPVVFHWDTRTTLARLLRAQSPVVPPISEDMGRVLTSLGYALREEYRWHHFPSRHLNLTFMTLFAGPARVCHDEAYMRWVLGSCIEGHTSMTFLLQDNAPADMRSVSPSYMDLCTSQISNLTLGSRCNVVIGQQYYNDSKSKTCSIRSGYPLQFISLSRSLEWAITSFPPHAFYIKARLDAPWCLPVDVGSEPFIALNHYKILVSENLTSHFPSDRYALVPRSLLPYYFDAWKVWLPLNCTAGPLLISNGNTTANQWLWNSGEAVLSAHMNKFYWKFAWKGVTWGGNPIVRHLNVTHVHYQGSLKALSYSSLLSQTPGSRQCELTEGGYMFTHLTNGKWHSPISRQQIELSGTWILPTD
jgi:hypothetical protein